MDATQTIALLGPVVGKLLTDLLKKFLPTLHAWQVQVLAAVVGTVSTWLVGYGASHFTGTQIGFWQTVIYGVGTIAVNELGNSIKDARADKGLKPGDNSGNFPGGIG